MSEPGNPSVQVRPTLEDYDAYRRQVRVDLRSGISHRALVWTLFALFAGVLAAAVQFFVGMEHVPAWLAVVGCLYPSWLIYSAAIRACEPLFLRSYLDPNGTFLNGFEAHADADGLRLVGSWGEALYRWNSIMRVKETATHIFAYVDRASAVLIPKRGFSSPAAATFFVEALRSRAQPAK